jgi:hypothetical protein
MIAESLIFMTTFQKIVKFVNIDNKSVNIDNKH